ncbi:MAG TPA: ABC transporter permease [Gemmatimonadaceae bacterium]|nr:ABC transporter permease [Gemmatimonadaceae bacterium]
MSRFTPSRAARALVEPLLAGLLSLLVLVALLAVSGFPVMPSLSALWNGAFGSWSVLASGTLVRATPLLFAGLAVTIAFRAGILNVGAEGQLLLGAVAATAVAMTVPPQLGLAGLALALCAGVAAGGAWAGIAAVLRQRFGVLEVISTIMLNVIALNLTGLLVRGPLQEPTRTFPQSDMVERALRLPRLIPSTRLHVGVAIAACCALGLAWFLRNTAPGFRLRLTGANPLAASSAGGIDVGRVSLLAFVASGALAGLGGAVEVMGVTYALYENLSPGYGYTAIAVALLARLNPAAAVGSALVFGALEAGASAMQRDAQVPAGMVGVVEACVILMLLASEWVGGRGGWRRSLNRGGTPRADPGSGSTPSNTAAPPAAPASALVLPPPASR